MLAHTAMRPESEYGKILDKFIIDQYSTLFYFSYSLSCPGNFFSSAASSGCFRCLAGFYYSIKGSCEACPVGTVCNSNGGATQENLTIAEGYWRVSSFSVDVIECPLLGGCAGASDFTELGDGYCSIGYTGPLCAVLWTDTSLIVFYQHNYCCRRYVTLVCTIGVLTQRDAACAKRTQIS